MFPSISPYTHLHTPLCLRRSNLIPSIPPLSYQVHKGEGGPTLTLYPTSIPPSFYIPPYSSPPLCISSIYIYPLTTPFCVSLYIPPFLDRPFYTPPSTAFQSHCLWSLHISLHLPCLAVYLPFCLWLRCWLCSPEAPSSTHSCRLPQPNGRGCCPTQ